MWYKSGATIKAWIWPSWLGMPVSGNRLVMLRPPRSNTPRPRCGPHGDQGRAGAGRPRMVTIQNPYNLLNRSFEVGLAEIAHRECCGLLAYSPMAFGALSGKYLGGARPTGARNTTGYPSALATMVSAWEGGTTLSSSP